MFVFESLPFQQTKLSDEISAFERRVIALQTARDELHTRATQAKHDYEGLLHKSAQECVQVQEWWHQEKLARLAAEDECRLLSVRALLCSGCLATCPGPIQICTVCVFFSMVETCFVPPVQAKLSQTEHDLRSIQHTAGTCVGGWMGGWVSK